MKFAPSTKNIAINELNRSADVANARTKSGGMDNPALDPYTLPNLNIKVDNTSAESIPSVLRFQS